MIGLPILFVRHRESRSAAHDVVLELIDSSFEVKDISRSSHLFRRIAIGTFESDAVASVAMRLTVALGLPSATLVACLRHAFPKRHSKF